MEHLLHTRGTQYRPRRTFIVAFGHDEEVTGLVRLDGRVYLQYFTVLKWTPSGPGLLSTLTQDGAGQVGKRLQERGERIEFLIDEGLPISVDLVS